QIHRWGEDPGGCIPGRKHVMRDWLVVERLLVRRGDPIGKRLEFKAAKDEKDKSPYLIHVEFPEWDKIINAFHIVGKQTQDRMGKKHWSTPFAIEFHVGSRPPVLV